LRGGPADDTAVGATAPAPAVVEAQKLAVDLRRRAQPETDGAAEVTTGGVPGGRL
jgi:hypothetical protein